MTNHEKLFHQADFTLYPKLFSAVKNVENAVRLLAYDNMKFLLSIEYFTKTPSLLSIPPLKNKMDSTIKENIDLYLSINQHLSQYEQCIKYFWKKEELRESIEEIYFLMHQAYLELDQAGLQPNEVKITSKNEKFEDYLRAQIQ